MTAVDFVEFPSKFGNLLKQSHSSSENIFKPSGCILEMCNLEELASFSKKNFMEGVKISVPFGLTAFKVQVIYHSMLSKNAARR